METQPNEKIVRRAPYIDVADFVTQRRTVFRRVDLKMHG